MSKQTNERRMREWALLLEMGHRLLNEEVRLLNGPGGMGCEELCRKDVQTAISVICGHLLRGEKVPSCKKYTSEQTERALASNVRVWWLLRP
jgi:hypothetical protein